MNINKLISSLNMEEKVKALDILKQIIESETLNQFIERNASEMSRRLYNIVTSAASRYKIGECSVHALADDGTIRKLRGIGHQTYEEFTDLLLEYTI